MKKLNFLKSIAASVLFIGLVCILSSTAFSAQDVIWKKPVGGGGADYFYGVTAVSDGIVAVGNSQQASFGNGDWTGISGRGGIDATIVRFDGNGNWKWKGRFGGSATDQFNAVTTLSDNYVVTVGYSATGSFGNGDWAGTGRGLNDAIIVKWSVSAAVKAKNFGGSGNDEFRSVTAVSDGIIAVGYSATFNNGDWAGIYSKGNTDAIIVKFDNDLNVKWKKNFGGSGNDEFYGVIAVPDGVIAAGFSAAGSFGNGDWTNVTGNGENDAIIVKFDNEGEVVWKKNFGGSANEIFYGVTTVSDGIVAAGFSAAGSFGNGDWTNVTGNGENDAIIVKFDNEGEVVWKKNFGGSAGDGYNSVITTADGIVAVGFSYPASFNNGDWADITGKGSVDAVIVNYDNNGNVVTKKNFGGDGEDRFTSVTALSDSVIAVGYTVPASFGNGDWEDVTGKGNFDAIIVKFGAPAFVQVTNITGVPTAATAGTPLTLTATVEPSDATNKTITWSVKDAGSTGATIDNGINPIVLNTTGAGTAEITATIADGLAVGTPYTKDFSITVTATGITTTAATEAKITGYYSIMGQGLPQAPEKGIYIIRYDNGKAEKVAR